MSIPFVDVKSFTPNSGTWTPVGDVQSVARAGNTFTLTLQGGARTLQISVLGPRCVRVRFNPTPGASYAQEISPAVVNRNLGTVALTIVEQSATRLAIDTGGMLVDVALQPYRLRVFRGAQLVSADEPSYNLIYIPNALVTANCKTRPDGARYCGFGEKAGAQVLKNLFTMTQFNYDNFSYTNQKTVPAGTQPGPLNPSDPLYASIPFMLEVNPAPTGPFAGAPYAGGIFFDNGGQSYFNMGANDYSNMDGKYYFGGLFNEMDYYYFLGDGPADVLTAYTTLTGRAPMPPKYVFGYHQGGYGYFDRAKLESVADALRASRIPCDGLHIDVDFQDNYRTFTHSERKFPNARQMLDNLRARGFKCSTNITPILTDNTLDENNTPVLYIQRDALRTAGALIYDTRMGAVPSSTLFQGAVNYGVNPPGFNPYPYPPNRPNADGTTPLSTTGNYPDIARAEVRTLWGEQYRHLVVDLGMDMVWQDMMCPALDYNTFEYGTFPLDLMVNNGATYVPNGVCHNVYGLYVLQGTWEGLAALRPGARNFIIARGGYAGMQRYAALWTGDSASSWDFLQINLPEVLNLGLSGVPISGCDIGGFADGTGCVPGSAVFGSLRMDITHFELLTRWMHLGSFLPWYRNHYNGYTKQFQEPYAYGEQVPTNCRRYVELRYRMLQMYYDAMYEWTVTGMPIARALFLNDPGDLAVYDHLDDEFFVGRDVLVAPILFSAAGTGYVAQRDIYLPSTGSWYAFHDPIGPLEPAVAGGTTVRGYSAGLDLVPIYIRAGAILPLRSLVEQYVGELAANPLDIVCYPGPDRQYRLYQDDGQTTRAAAANEFRLTQITQQTAPGTRSVRITRITDQYTPPEPYFTVTLLETPKPSIVHAEGVAVPNVGSAAGLAASAVTAYYYDATRRATVVKVLDQQADVTVAVS